MIFFYYDKYFPKLFKVLKYIFLENSKIYNFEIYISKFLFRKKNQIIFENLKIYIF